MMTRKGCNDCGEVFACEADMAAADRAGACVGVIVALPTAADVLAFRLRFTGRRDEATGVLDDHAAMQEHTR